MNYEISDKIDQLSSAWHEFKSLNEKRLTAIEKKHSIDPSLNEQINKLNTYIDEIKDKIDFFETKSQLPTYQYESKTDNYDEYRNSFNNFLRKGNIEQLEKFERKSLTSLKDEEGRFLVTPHITDSVTNYIEISSPMRKIASIEKISTDSLEILEEDDKANSGWVAENDPRNDTDVPKFRKNKILMHELYAQPKATQKLIDDSAIDIERWLAEKISESFIDKENQAFIFGDGANKPRGILAYNRGKNWGEIEEFEAENFDFDFIINSLYSLKNQYASKAIFLMHRSTAQILRTIKDNNNNYIWNPFNEYYKAGTLLGLPLIECDEMPIYEKGKDKSLIAIGDFKKAYKIVDRKGIQILRDPYTEKPFVKFYATKRVGGAVVNYDAIKLLKILK